MKARELLNLGYPKGPIIPIARAAAGQARVAGMKKARVRMILEELLTSPETYKDDPIFARLAETLMAQKPARRRAEAASYQLNESLQYKQWGIDIDEQTCQQMRNACKLPISVAAALMPDAHLGYGLPIGGVLATRNAVIPYAVGVDIACRMMMTVYDLPPEKLVGEADRFRKVLEANTQFGVGAQWRTRQEHPVMDENWAMTPVTAKLKDKAHRQLGTSGSGNHFVEFGELTVSEETQGIPPGRYLALMSHSGSRGPGNVVATHYSKVAMSKHPNLPRELKHLAWLDMDDDGREYWSAMELMGRYASANHHVIHDLITRALGESPVSQIENHHNFAWKETHQGESLIVHRKGATPAGKDAVGIIPGSMAAPAYVVKGLGNETSLNSASHGAGRVMSRKQAIRTYRWAQARKYLAEKKVTLLSAGLDEVPWVYKDIDAVMKDQKDLVAPVARFMPQLVKMAPAGERPED